MSPNNSVRSKVFESAPKSALGSRVDAPWQELSSVAAALVRCGRVSGLLMLRMCHSPLMLCVDQALAVGCSFEFFSNFYFAPFGLWHEPVHGAGYLVWPTA